MKIHLVIITERLSWRNTLKITEFNVTYTLVLLSFISSRKLFDVDQKGKERMRIHRFTKGLVVRIFFNFKETRTRFDE